MHSSPLLLCATAVVFLGAAPVDQKDIEFGHPGSKPLLLDLHETVLEWRFGGLIHP